MISQFDKTQRTINEAIPVLLPKQFFAKLQRRFKKRERGNANYCHKQIRLSFVFKMKKDKVKARKKNNSVQVILKNSSFSQNLNKSD